MFLENDYSEATVHIVKLYKMFPALTESQLDEFLEFTSNHPLGKLPDGSFSTSLLKNAAVIINRLSASNKEERRRTIDLLLAISIFGEDSDLIEMIECGATDEQLKEKSEQLMADIKEDGTTTMVFCGLLISFIRSFPGGNEYFEHEGRTDQTIETLYAVLRGFMSADKILEDEAKDML